MVGKILIIDDLATNRIVMRSKLMAAGYQPAMAADGASGLAAAQREKPDLIMIELSLPDMTGIELLRHLRDMPTLAAVPVIIMAASPEPNDRIAAFRFGADDFLTKPIDEQTILARIRNFQRAGSLLEALEAQQHEIVLMGMAEAQQGFCPAGTIVLLNTRPELALKRQRELAKHGTNRVLVMSPAEALNEATNPATRADVFLVDAGVDGTGSGLRLMSDLRSRGHTRHAKVCIVKGSDMEFNPAVAFDLGADDLIDAAVVNEELAARLQRLIQRKRDEDRLRESVQDGLRMAMIDPLTGLHNRRYGMAQLASIQASARAEGSDFAVMVADLDRFKAVNDRLGHAAGDAVLVEVANRLARNLRAGDLVARIGGEEFLIVLPKIDLAEAERIGRRLCEVVEASPIAVAGGSLRITVSLGLAASLAGRPRPSVSEIVESADQALLRSKLAGRNQLTIGLSAA
jgi:two-component system, cell cycle response regulator